MDKDAVSHSWGQSEARWSNETQVEIMQKEGSVQQVDDKHEKVQNKTGSEDGTAGNTKAVRGMKLSPLAVQGVRKCTM